jgi:uncharacterized protein YecE (DUF72 family)
MMVDEPAPTGNVMVGTAGWSIPPAVAAEFPGAGSHLERFARQLHAAEINSSFHRRHQVSTYARWARSVPSDFLFSVKLAKTITHVHRLIGVDELLDAFMADVSGLGDKLGAILVQLPPSLTFDPSVAEAFFTKLMDRANCAVVCEPRHPTWFTPEADTLLTRYRIARVAADPAPVPGADRPGGWRGVRYHRLHGSPRAYYSFYDQPYLQHLAASLQQEADFAVPRWCIFDNTASGAAISNAMELASLLAAESAKLHISGST